jgi:hypothetical protein
MPTWLHFAVMIAGIVSMIAALGGLVWSCLHEGDLFSAMWLPVLFIAGVVMITIPAALTDEPFNFTSTVGATPVSVTHLTYLNGTLGRTAAVRVDTSHGPIVVSIDAAHPVPSEGDLYFVIRRHKWRDATRMFLCTLPANGYCWPER